MGKIRKPSCIGWAFKTCSKNCEWKQACEKEYERLSKTDLVQYGKDTSKN